MTESKSEMPLQLVDEDVLLKRVASNFERHGDDSVPVLDISCEAMLPPGRLVGLLGQYCDRTLFNTKGALLEPADLFKRTDMPLPVDEELVAQYVKFVLSDNREREFGERPAEGDKPSPSQLCPITSIRYEPKIGGLVWVGFSIRVRPRDGIENWAFLEHNGRHAKLTIADSAIKVGNGKQQSLPLQQPDQGVGFAAGAAARANGGEQPEPGPPADSEPPQEAAPSTSSPSSSLEDIGPKTRAEIEKVKARQSRRPRDRQDAH